MEKSEADHTKNLPQPRYPKVQIDPADLERLGDEDGQSYSVIPIEGMYFPSSIVSSGFVPDPRISIPQIRDMETRPDDVFICAYQKAGTHWLWEIVKMLQKGAADYEEDSKEVAMLEFQTAENLEKAASPRVFNTHLLFRFLPKKLVENKIKVIFLQRNPKDVAVSFYHHIIGLKMESYQPTWDSYLSHFKQDKVLLSAWSEYIADWEKNLKNIPEENVLYIYFEDLKKDAVTEIKRVAQFLGKNAEDAKLINAVEERCSFQNLKTAKTKLAESQTSDIFKRGSKLMYRKGQVGDWKNWFSVAQNEEFDRYLAQVLRNSDFVYKYI